MSYAAVTAKNAPPPSEQPHPDLGLLNTENSPTDTFANENSRVGVVEVDPRTNRVENDPAQQDVLPQKFAPEDFVIPEHVPQKQAAEEHANQEHVNRDHAAQERPTQERAPRRSAQPGSSSTGRPAGQSRDDGAKRKAIAKVREGEKSALNILQRYFIRPHVAGGLLGVVNTGLLAGLGYAFYSQPQLLREPKFLLMSTTLAATTVYVEEVADISTHGFELTHHDNNSGARNLSGAIGLMNAAAMGGLGYLGFMHWDRPHWDRRALPAVAVGILAVLGGESIFLDSLHR